MYEMMKNRYKDFKKSKMTRPFFVKAMDTLQVLMGEVNNGYLYKKLCNSYSEVAPRARTHLQVNTQNTFKLVLRCRIYFSARALIFTLFEQIKEFEVRCVRLVYLLCLEARLRAAEVRGDPAGVRR